VTPAPEMSLTPAPDMSLRVLEPGPLTTVQDGGRPGRAHEGVPPGGALDRASAALANRLVGNGADAAVLEATATGPRLVLDGPAGQVRVVAVTGAEGSLLVGGRPADANAPVTAAVGQEIAIGPATGGIRRYLAVGGGLVVPPVLGSRSTDVLSGLGPPVLRVGDVLPLGPVVGPPPALDVAPVRSRPGVLELRLRPGPRQDWLTPGAWGALWAATWVVRPESNRVGLRLDGPRLERAQAGELPPEGLVTGSLQVPHQGAPVLFLADHPVTGGYPVAGVVADGDLDAAGQAGPGVRVRFVRWAARAS
jgi:biotin-dependent carboxylase-like uncharacterized protein